MVQPAAGCKLDPRGNDADRELMLRCLQRISHKLVRRAYRRRAGCSECPLGAMSCAASARRALRRFGVSGFNRLSLGVGD